MILHCEILGFTMVRIQIVFFQFVTSCSFVFTDVSVEDAALKFRMFLQNVGNHPHDCVVVKSRRQRHLNQKKIVGSKQFLSAVRSLIVHFICIHSLLLVIKQNYGTECNFVYIPTGTKLVAANGFSSEKDQVRSPIRLYLTSNYVPFSKRSQVKMRKMQTWKSLRFNQQHPCDKQKQKAAEYYYIFSPYNYNKL